MKNKSQQNRSLHGGQAKMHQRGQRKHSTMKDQSRSSIKKQADVKAKAVRNTLSTAFVKNVIPPPKDEE